MLTLTDCPCKGGTLDRLIQPAILAVLAEGPLHGYRLAARISEIPGFAAETQRLGRLPLPDEHGAERARHRLVGHFLSRTGQEMLPDHARWP